MLLKTHIVSFCLVFLAITGMGAGAQAQDSPKTYQANFSALALTIDGYLDEAQWDAVDWSDYFIDIEGQLKPDPPYKTKMKMLWDKHYLYIAAILEEPHIWGTLQNRDDIIYRDNDFEVFVDPDGDRLNYYELEINALGTEFDLFLSKPYNQKGKPNIAWNFEGLKTAVQLRGSLNDPSDIDNGWTVELAIPWHAFSADELAVPKNGDSWRINFSRVQWDLEIIDGQYSKKKNNSTGKNLPEKNWVWSPQGVINMHIPEKWGYLEFVGRPDQANDDYPKFWIWARSDSKKSVEEWDSIYTVLNEIGIKGILMGADSMVLERTIPIAKKYDIETHAWFWTMNRGEAKDEWLSVNQLGNSLATQKAYVNYYKFMCPALPEVKDYVRSKLESLAKIKGLKGIHMDYIRYVDVILPEGLWDKYGLVQDHIMPEYDYGYHPYMRQIFKEKYGIDPMEIEHIETDSLWLQFRLEELNKTVIDLRDYVNSEGLSITAAVFPTPDMSRTMVRQDWDAWGLDYYFPMVYHNFYNEGIDWITEVVKEGKSSLSENEKLICGLYLPALKNDNDLTKAIKAAFKGGADGIAFFDLNALTESQRKQIHNFILSYEK